MYIRDCMNKSSLSFFSAVAVACGRRVPLIAAARRRNRRRHCNYLDAVPMGTRKARLVRAALLHPQRAVQWRYPSTSHWPGSSLTLLRIGSAPPPQRGRTASHRAVVYNCMQNAQYPEQATNRNAHRTSDNSPQLSKAKPRSTSPFVSPSTDITLAPSCVNANGKGSALLPHSRRRCSASSSSFTSLCNRGLARTISSACFHSLAGWLLSAPTKHVSPTSHRSNFPVAV